MAEYDEYKSAFIFIGFKNVALGLIQSRFLGYDLLELILLISVKLIIIIPIFCNKNVCGNKVLRFTNIIYFISGIIIDIMIILSKT